MADMRPPNGGTSSSSKTRPHQDYELGAKSSRGRTAWIPWVGAVFALMLAAAVLLTLTGLTATSQWVAERMPLQHAAEPTALGVPVSVDVAANIPMDLATEQQSELTQQEPSQSDSENPISEPAAVIAQVASPTARVAVGLPTPTPEPGGEVFEFEPRSANVGWWVSGDVPQIFIGDSFLYSGFGDQETYVAAAQFDLGRVPRGADVRSAKLLLTGLRDDLLDRDGETSWLVQLVAEAALPQLAGTDFSEIYNAPASITLSPDLTAIDVAAGRINEWTLDVNAREWLYQQLVAEATTVVVRIRPFNVGSDSLFAWDSGAASESEGNAPKLILDMGPPPPIPPPTPTRPIMVATLTPVPENVLTVVAQAAASTAETATGSSETPSPVEIITPTPVPENLATVQAAALIEGLPAVVRNTPVPANASTATANSEYATAVALTTGTFTPIPTNYVTPAIYYPPPPPENVATAAVRVLAATAVAARGGAAPTRPWNAVAAVYVFATETPSNAETAVAQIIERNSAAIAEGTPTPTPWNLVVITSVPVPTATPIPLIVAADSVTATPTPTPTLVVSESTLDEFRGKLLFLSDRGGSTQIWVMDPDSGEVLALVRDERFHEVARELFLPRSVDGTRRAYVDVDGRRDLQIFVEDLQYGTRAQVTNLRSWDPNAETTNYDPAWSPTADQIAFVSTESGGDEIYVLDVGESDPERLTFNSWEWDKHPTWSPDGSQIAFFSNRDTGRTQIWVMNADGSGQRNLSNNEYSDWDPVWVR